VSDDGDIDISSGVRRVVIDHGPPHELERFDVHWFRVNDDEEIITISMSARPEAGWDQQEESE
jgi:hypothetical protein